MGPAAIGTAVGAATVTVGRGALTAVGNGLSFLAQLADATSGIESPAEVRQNSVQAAFKERCDQLRQRIERQLAACGIKLSQPVDLMSNGQGGVAVAGAHPQQSAIEAAISTDILLERDFNLLAQDAETSNLVITVPK
jgi:hypothetical protein